MTSRLDLMAEAYWNAFRTGHMSVGGDRSYPTWKQASPAVKNETLRCLRFAVEQMRDLVPTFDEAFPEPLVRKRDLDLDVTALLSKRQVKALNSHMSRRKQ